MTHCSITKILYAINESDAIDLGLKNCHYIIVTHLKDANTSNTYSMKVWTNTNADINKLLNYWNAIGKIENKFNFHYHYVLEKSENGD